LLGPEEQMRRVHACSVVASMENAHVAGARPVQHPRQPVGLERARLVQGRAKAPIPISVQFPGPQPTTRHWLWRHEPVESVEQRRVALPHLEILPQPTSKEHRNG
jgi:hypothetical protein